jgi:hypothetical protein
MRGTYRGLPLADSSMQFLCPVCASSAVEPAGRTETYQSLVCADCLSWSTVPVAPPIVKKRDGPPRPPDKT